MSDRIAQLFRTTFSLPATFALDDSLGPSQVPGWDSLGGLVLVNAIEEEFNLTLSDEDVLGIETVGTVRELIKRKGVAC
jgi:acyl carrier protein